MRLNLFNYCPWPEWGRRFIFFFEAEDGIRDDLVTGVQTCALPILAERACRQVERYLDDGEFRFDLPLAPAGSAFQCRVWDRIAEIPAGESRTYGELARRLHTAAIAVGGACGANPIALVVPCHRVVGTHGPLGGFMGVTDGDPIAVKPWLVAHA